MIVSDWAAWIQAIGSIIAIFGAAGIAVWQSNKQHKSSLALLREDRRLERIEVARSLLSLSESSLILLKNYARQLKDRETIHRIGEGIQSLDINELSVVEGAVRAIPLHSLPHQLVSLTMMVNSTIRQYKEHIQLVLNVYHQMSTEEFSDFFLNLERMQKGLQKVCDEIRIEVAKFESNA